EEDRQDRDQRNHRQQEGDQPEEADERHAHPRRQRIADAPTDRLPAGVADVDGGWKRATEERADDGADSIREGDPPEVVAVTGRLRALDVVHALGEVVDTERDRGDEEGPDVREPREDVTRRYGKLEPGLSQRRADGGRLHDPAPAEKRRDPPDRGPDD